MQFNIEKNVSNFIESQFPDLYKDKGPDFILFVQTYYEWLESQKDIITNKPNIIGAARNLLDYRDIDNTLEEFLVHFQKKYLYGIPFNVIINKRFLLKHVLDVYRSKGSIQGYKLLFKLLYNQDVEIYLPRNDILAPSDGTWIQPRYVEVSDNGLLASYIGQSITGLSSGVTSVVEDFIREKINGGIVCTFYLSNITPAALNYIEGETIVITGTNDPNVISNSPIVLGSLDSLNIVNGGANFRIGDILKVADHDTVTGKVSSFGVNGLIKVTGLTSTQGNIVFNIKNPGFGYLANSDILIYNSTNNVVKAASFTIESIGLQKSITYNTDILADYLDIPLNANSYNLPNNPSANLSSTIGSSLVYQTEQFGSILSLTNIVQGNNYLSSPYIFVSTNIVSKVQQGNVSFSNTSNIVTGTNTLFTRVLSNNSIICLGSNTTYEKQVVLNIISDTKLILYGNTFSSGNNKNYKIASCILPSNFITQNPIMASSDGSINGLNTDITGTASSGNNNASSVTVIDSGRGYVDNEIVRAYLYNSLNPVNILNGGINYANGDILNYIGGTNNIPASGKITTDSNGTIVSISSTPGSNYTNIPSLVISSKIGSNAELSVTILEYNTTYNIQGNVIKTGMGKSQGYWSTTRGFLNSDKYIQDSYFYQDFAYQIKAASILENYKNILYNTFHPAGSEMFGEYYAIDTVLAPTTNILAETVNVISPYKPSLSFNQSNNSAYVALVY